MPDLKGIADAARSLAGYIDRRGDQADTGIILAQLRLMIERLRPVIVNEATLTQEDYRKACKP